MLYQHPLVYSWTHSLQSPYVSLNFVGNCHMDDRFEDGLMRWSCAKIDEKSLNLQNHLS